MTNIFSSLFNDLKQSSSSETVEKVCKEILNNLQSKAA